MYSNVLANPKAKNSIFFDKDVKYYFFCFVNIFKL